MIRIINQVCCISFDSYIKPQLVIGVRIAESVVYLLIPTSNHNRLRKYIDKYLLYIFWFLHQTTTRLFNSPSEGRLYIFWFLHQTTTFELVDNFRKWLYIFWFLHQTTTWRLFIFATQCCISFDSYIKPQPNAEPMLQTSSCISFDSYIKPQLCGSVVMVLNVVYLLIPTSNHNVEVARVELTHVVYLLIPTSNHNLPVARLSS